VIAFADLLQLDWRNPWWLLLALQPLLVAALLRLRRHRLLRYADAHLLPWAVSSQVAASESRARRAGHAVFWLLIACALAGPRLPAAGAHDDPKRAAPRHDMDLIVVLDVSPSMRAQDVTPDRLTRAKLKLLDLSRRLRGERLGLIAFSGEAGVLMPPTRDRALLAHYLPLAQPELFEDAGTQLAFGLRLALAQRDGERGLAVLLVTDGEASALSGASGNAALAAARELNAARVPLYVLAVGSEQGATIPSPDGGVVEENGAPVVSRLDAAGFGALAATTGGRLARISGDDGDLAQLYDRGMLTLRAAGPHPDGTQAWRELYPWLLAPALLLWLLLSITPRGAAVAALALAATSAHAGGADAWREAYQSYRKQDYLLAQQRYAQQDGWEARMGEGASAYRRKDYGHAVKQFTEALLLARTPNERADALFNLGNSHYLAGNKRAALDALQDVLRYRDDAKARANLARVTAQMKAAPAPAGEGVSGRRGRGLGQGDNPGGEAPMGMEATKEQPQVWQEQDGPGSEEARGAGGRQQGEVDAQADVRAAQKKLELVRDQPDQLAKRLITQDHSPEATGAQRPW
jgi:Ca-activated chloride channel family protein